jgi:O-antigen ligase
VRLVFLAALVGWAGFSGWLAVIAHSQPRPVDLAPFARFLQQPPQGRYRYLTLGFGDQFARLSTLTHNGTLDGAYHTARELPELRMSGIGALDTALWSKPGVWAVAPFLAHPQRYGLRWVFVNHPAYVRVLEAAGWRFRWQTGGVTVWDYPGVRPVPVREPGIPRRSLSARWWGSAPVGVLIVALLTWALERRLWAVTRADLIRLIAQLRAGSLTVTVLLLSLWWVRVLYTQAAPVYFTYRSAMLFASDVAAALTVGLWLAERALRRDEPVHFGPRSLGLTGLGLVGACALSTLTSEARPLSLAFLAHLLALAGLYLLCVNDPPSPEHLGWMFAGAIFLQALVVLAQVEYQGSFWMRYLPWPGLLSVASPGVSVVENAEGLRWFRAYGTLPHPNILGGMLLIYLGGVAGRFLATGRARWLAPLGLGVMAGALTFSRSAWLGVGAMLFAGLSLLPRACWRPASWIVLVGLAAAFLTLWPLRSFVVARAGVGTGIGATSVGAEQRSLNERALLIEHSLNLIRERPGLGVGAGAFVVALASRPELHAPPEPVHNLLLLVTAETGLLGALALTAWGGGVGLRLWQRRQLASPTEAMWAIVLVGVLTVAMLDHYWWTLAPARTLAVLAFGLWVGAGHQPGVTPPRPG